MKYILIFLLCISNSLIGMLPMNFDKIEHFVSINKTEMKRVKSHNPHKPELNINNNGKYFTHDIKNRTTYLIDTTNNIQLDEFLQSTPISFSPNNKYCVISSKLGCYYYNLAHKINYTLSEQYPHRITISDDSNQFLIELKNNVIPRCSRYKLYRINHEKLPKGIHLKKDLENATAIAFHPDNKHIIYNKINGIHDVLHLYNISTEKDTEIASLCDENSIHITDITYIHDNRILAKTISQHCDTYNYGYIFFNIKNLDDVTSIILPQQSCHKKAVLPILCILYPKMFTHITDNGGTLQLLDETMNILASYNAPKNHYISALAVDPNEKNLAIGYSDGTINIYTISFFKLDEKNIVNTSGIIKSLTWSDNGLLLARSQLNKKSDSTPALSAVRLLDIHGNTIHKFTNNIVNSVMSKNGRKIVTISLEKPNFLVLNSYDLNEQ